MLTLCSVGQVWTLRYEGQGTSRAGREPQALEGISTNLVDVGRLAALVCTDQVECGMALLGTGVTSLWVLTFPCSALGSLRLPSVSAIYSCWVF